MCKNIFAKHRRAGAALRPAVIVLLVLSLLMLSLLSGCAEDPKTGASTVPSTPAPTEQSTEAPAATLPPETVPSEPASTEPAVTLPPDWTPSLNKTDISFFGPGESFTLTVPGAPGGLEILWSAEDEAVAAVDQNGRVTAVGPGSARIYAEVAGTKLECWIRCPFDAPPAEDAPALNKTDISFFGVGESFRLSVEHAPEDAEILWSSEDYGVASVDQTGRVRAVGPGTIRVRAQVNGVVLSCWVRCQFAAPELPRSSIADGSWRVILHKRGVTVLNEEAEIFVAQAQVLSRVRVAEERLKELEPNGKLDLSDFGLGSFRVSSIDYGADGTSVTVTAGDAVLLFSRYDAALWTLVSQNGEPFWYVSGEARLVFDGDSRIYDQKGEDGSSAVRRADVLDLFDLQPGSEETVSPVVLELSDGLVTKAVWQR
ncbi:MAG: Ig-like domain-containing protein [Oscillospiraceae bacterium]|nr:Ig-like domain-containing protein [Oscillospiraceae bacterium]MBR7009881.1 Ig-like domain-containing protein [Oscillospiraceae bacterium]